MKTTHRIKEWQEKSEAVLAQELGDLREKLRSLRFLLSQGKLKNNQEIRKTKKDIARILTIINSRNKHA